MKADLRNFALYQQNYLMDRQGSYFSGNGAAEGFVPTSGVTVTQGQPPAWVTYSPLLPLALLLFSGLYLFVLPHAAKWRSGGRID